MWNYIYTRTNIIYNICVYKNEIVSVFKSQHVVVIVTIFGIVCNII